MSKETLLIIVDALMRLAVVLSIFVLAAFVGNAVMHGFVPPRMLALAFVIPIPAFTLWGVRWWLTRQKRS